MAWDDELGEGRGKRALSFVSGQGTVFLYRIVVGALTAFCAGMSGLIFNGFLDQGKQLAALLAMQPQTQERLHNIEETIGSHTVQINGAATQERMDTIVLQNQITQIIKKLDDVNDGLDAVQQKLKDQDTKVTNLGVAVARVRGAQQAK